MSIAEGLAATKAGLDLARRLTDALNRPDVDVNDVRAKLQEMLIHVVNAHVALGEAETESAELRRRVEQRDASAALRDDMDFERDGGFYFRRSEVQHGRVAYCPICWAKDDKVVPLEVLQYGLLRCSVHNTSYETAQYRAYKEKKGVERINRLPEGGRPYSPFGD